MRFLLTPGQAGDNPQPLPLLDGISVGHLGPGRPRCRPETVIADKAYSHPSTRQAMRDRRIRFVSPERDDQIARRAAKGCCGGRPPVFDPEVYKQRDVVERCFNRLKQFRDLATRYANAPPATRQNSPSLPSCAGFFQRDFIRKQRESGLPLHLIAHEDVVVFKTTSRCG